MLTIYQSLTAINKYPIDRLVIVDACESNGLNPDNDATAEVRTSKAYRNACAVVYRYLTEAPNVSQGGISITIDAETRKRYRSMATQIEKEAEGGQYGYMGENF